MSKEMVTMDELKEGYPESRQIERIPVGMRPGRRQLNEASLQVSMCEAVPETMRAKTREITRFHVEPHMRRRKLGTLLLNLVCQEADANGMTLVLIARPPDDEVMNEDQLVEFYMNFGFTKLQDTLQGTFMARPVHERKRVKLVERTVKEILQRLH